MLRGVDVRDPADNSKRIPYWIDYTKLTVNGKVIFDELTPVWHNAPYSYTIDAKAGEEIKIQVEWLPHRDDKLNVPALPPPVQKKTEPAIDKKFLPYLTSRLDVKLGSKEQGELQIVSVSDDNAAVEKATWLPKTETGYFIQSYVGKIEIVTKPTAEGQITLDLKGVDIRRAGKKSKRIPYWIDFTKLVVNGKVIFDKLTPAWHNAPYSYTIDVKAGEEVKIQAEWLPHRSD